MPVASTSSNRLAFAALVAVVPVAPSSSIRTRFELRDGRPVLVRLAEVNFVDDNGKLLPARH